MTKEKYSDKQQALIEHIKTKIQNLQKAYPMVGHEMDHIHRVISWTRQIAAGEKARQPFLCELAAWLHDIGRAYEHIPEKNPDQKRHQELSYEILKAWIHEDEFNILNDDEKIELLYAVRYHGNDVADEYDTAWIIRDADKMDMFGEIGLKRVFDSFPNDKKKIDLEIRIKFGTLYWIHTETAKKLLSKFNMAKPMEDYQREILKERIEPIEL